MYWNEFIEIKKVGFSARFFGKPFWWKTQIKRREFIFVRSNFFLLSKIKAIFSMKTKPTQIYSNQQGNNSTWSDSLNWWTTFWWSSQQPTNNNMLLNWEDGRAKLSCNFCMILLNLNWKRKRKKWMKREFFRMHLI